MKSRNKTIKFLLAIILLLVGGFGFFQIAKSATDLTGVNIIATGGNIVIEGNKINVVSSAAVQTDGIIVDGAEVSADLIENEITVSGAGTTHYGINIDASAEATISRNKIDAANGDIAAGSGTPVINSSFNYLTGTINFLTSNGTINSYKDSYTKISGSGTFNQKDYIRNDAITALTVTQSGTGDIVNFKDGVTSVFKIADGGVISSELDIVVDPQIGSAGALSIGGATDAHDHELKIYGYDSGGSTNRYLSLTHTGTDALVETSFGTEWLHLGKEATDLTGGVMLFGNSISGENREFRVYGYNTAASGSKYGSLVYDDTYDALVIKTDTGHIQIGNAGPQDQLTSPTNDDLFVSGRLEVDGIAYLSETDDYDVAMGTPIARGSIQTNLDYPISVYVSGKYAYVASPGNERLCIFDISNPDSIIAKGFTNTNLHDPHSVYVSGKYAYVASTSNNRLCVFDISNPDSIIAKGFIETNLDLPWSVYVSGKYAYMASGDNDSLVIFDISNPDSIIAKGHIETNLDGPVSVYVSGKYAYVAGGTRLCIFDISNPDTIVAKGFIATLDNPHSVYVSGKYAYVAGGQVMQGNGHLEIFDVSNPDFITAKGSIVTNLNGSSSVHVSGKYAYVANYGNDRLCVFDISNPMSIVDKGFVETNLGHPMSVYISGKYAYVAEYNSDGLEIFDISGIDTPTIMAGSIGGGNLDITDNAIIGNNLYVQHGLNVGTAGIYSHGEVGIYATSSSSGLTVTQTGAGSIVTATSTSSMTSTAFQISNLGSGDSFLVEDSSSDSTPFVIDPDGKVGIGTASPDNLLSLNKVSGDVIMDFDLADADKWVMGIDDSDNDYFKINPGNTLANVSDFTFKDNGDLRITGALTVGAASTFLADGSLTGPGAGGMTVTNAGDLTISTASSGALSVSSDGTLALSSSDWAISTTGDMTGIGSIDQGLVAWWPLDEGTGDDIADKSGKSNDGAFFDCGTSADGWIAVPGNATYGTSNFCAMKYEAKYDKTGDGDGDTQGDCKVNASYNTWDWGKTGGDCPAWVRSNVVSTANGSPIAGINQTQSIDDACPSGSHLMTNNEWMTIARNVEQVDANWQSGTKGSGCMYGGHMDNHPADALAASTDDDPYSGTTDTSGEDAVCPFNTTDGNKASKRTFTLSNGEVIWDLSGNVWEWISDEASTTPGGGGWQEIENVSGWTADVPKSSVASAGGYTSADGIGKIWTNALAGRAFARGGNWYNGAYAGAFALSLDGGPGYSYYGLGFRCVRD